MKNQIQEGWLSIIIYLVLSAAGLLCLLPFLHLYSVSVSEQTAVMSGQVLFWPVGWTLDAYRELLVGTRTIGALFNSVIITGVGVALSLLCTVLAAYPLSRKYFIMRKPLSLAIVFTMIFGGGLIPTFMVIKSLGMINSYGAIWLLNLVSVYNLLVMKSYFENIPEELDDAARMDGCKEAALLFRVMLPLSLPMLATIALFYGISYWNMFMTVLIYINDTNKYNLVVLVQQMVQNNTLIDELNRSRPEDVVGIVPEMMKAAGIVVLTTPMLMIYPFVQKYFVKGVLVGAIKG